MQQFQIDLLEMGPRVAMWLWWSIQILRDAQGNLVEHTFKFAEAKKQAAHHQRLSGRTPE